MRKLFNQWTTAHEVGHLLNMQHVTTDVDSKDGTFTYVYIMGAQDSSGDRRPTASSLEGAYDKTNNKWNTNRIGISGDNVTKAKETDNFKKK